MHHLLVGHDIPQPIRSDDDELDTMLHRPQSSAAGGGGLSLLLSL
jgi:hypothetical protein